MGKYRKQSYQRYIKWDNGWTTFALWVVNAQVTKMSGSDHREEFRIGGSGQVKLQYTMGEVDMSASLQARLQPS